MEKPVTNATQFFRNPSEYILDGLREEYSKSIDDAQKKLDDFKSTPFWRFSLKSKRYEEMLEAHDKMLEAKEEFYFMLHCLTGE
jgi:hypothetical protein